MKKSILSLLMMGMCFPVNAAVVVIGHAQGVDSISVDSLKRLYLGKGRKLENGENAQLFELPEGAAERTEFHSKTTGRSDAHLQSNWSRLVFTGKAVAPVAVADNAAAINFVKSTPNAIGYVDESAVSSDVKILLKL